MYKVKCPRNRRGNATKTMQTIFKSMYKYLFMILIVIYCKIKGKQVLYKHKCDKGPLECDNMSRKLNC